MATVYVFMGVSGSGKTTVGSAVASKLAVPFYDADNFHPAENIAKMAGGVPLDDTDRSPWLVALNRLIADVLARGETAVLACSALKRKYRETLRQGNEAVCFVYLKGSQDLILQRMEARGDHYMKPEMLRSQIAALEEPEAANTIVVDIGYSVEQIVRELILVLDNKSGSAG